MPRPGSERSAALELAILGLLKEHDLHGYELKRQLSEALGFASGVSFGSLYPALARLEAAGAVKAVEAVAPTDGSASRAAPIPLTGSLGGEFAAFRAKRAATGRGGRGKKVYGITAEGETRFEELIASESGDDDRLFTLRMLFARHVSPEVRIEILGRRRRLLVERLSTIDRRRDRLDGREREGFGLIDSYARRVADHERDAVAIDIAWVDRLVAEERTALAQRADQHSALAQRADQRTEISNQKTHGADSPVRTGVEDPTEVPKP